MMRSLFSGVSGIKVHQTRMDVIGNNIANINTIGFKSSRTTFSDMLSQLQSSAAAPTEGLGGVNAKQIGLGVNVESIDLIFTDSSPQQTGKNTDLALSGNGLFVLKNGNQSYYTRNGAFMFDEQGYYGMPGSGLRVQGWNGVNGTINTNGQATDIIVPVGKTMEAKATTTIEYNGNLDKESLIITAITPTKTSTGDLSLVATYDGYTTKISFQDVNGTTVTAEAATDEAKSAGDTVPITVTSTPAQYTVTLSSTDGTITPTDPTTTITSTTELTEYTLTVTNVSTPDADGKVTYTLEDDNGNEFELESTTDLGLAVGDPYTATASSAPTAGTTYTVTYTDSEGNVLHTVSNVAEADVPTETSVDADVTADSTTGSVTSINVDTENAQAAIITLSDGTTRNVTSGYYEVGKSIPLTTLATIYDSLGGQHQVTLLMDKDSTTVDQNLTDEEALATATVLDATTGEKIVAGNVQVVRDTAGNVTGYTYTDANGDTQNATTDQIVFYNRWKVYIAPGIGQKGPASSDFTNSYTRSAATDNPEEDGSGTTGTMDTINYIYFSDRGQYISNGRDELGTIHFAYFDGNGAAEQDASINFEDMTQYANSTTAKPITDGNTAGVLQSLAVDGQGIISGTYTNGLVQQEAQIAVAQFNNSGGLTKVGTTIYQESNNSGAANVKTIADFGLNVVSSALEMSNVDLATEFSDMIITQRGFQANSKVTTVSDEMLETLVNMKR